MSLDTKSVQFLTCFIVESDAIENIQANPRLVRFQLEDRVQEGHVGAMLFLEALAREKAKLLTQETICRVQRLITAEQHTKFGGPKLKPEYIGNYRIIDVSIGGRTAPQPVFVPLIMKTWIAKVIKWQKECHVFSKAENLRRVAIFHFEYEHIHPFVDGNGRSGRALVYYLMRYCGLNPFTFTSDDKYENYYPCFALPETMCRYFESKMSDR